MIANYKSILLASDTGIDFILQNDQYEVLLIILIFIIINRISNLFANYSPNCKIISIK